MNQTFVIRGENDMRRLWLFLKNNAKACVESKRPLAIKVQEYKRNRSLEQNRMLHKQLQIISEQAWVNGRQYDLEVWKEMIKRRFIGTEEVELPSGEVVQRGISTTTLDVESFSELIEQVWHYMAAELGLEVERVSE